MNLDQADFVGGLVMGGAIGYAVAVAVGGVKGMIKSFRTGLRSRLPW